MACPGLIDQTKRSAQRVTLDQAPAAYIRDAANAEFSEETKGTLEPGKLADSLVLSQDLDRVPPPESRKTPVVLAVEGGKVVHREGI